MFILQVVCEIKFTLILLLFPGLLPEVEVEVVLVPRVDRKSKPVTF